MLEDISPISTDIVPPGDQCTYMAPEDVLQLLWASDYIENILNFFLDDLVLAGKALFFDFCPDGGQEHDNWQFFAIDQAFHLLVTWISQN
jgi:hypothetical protein